MKQVKTVFDSVVVFEPEIYEDVRGYFYERYNKEKFDRLIGYEIDFVQDNFSKSKRNVIRGIHYQLVKPQGKLISVARGSVLDVVVDLRFGSDTFGKWEKIILSDENKLHCWVPKGFGHAFQALEDSTEVIYKVTDYYAPGNEKCIRFNDPDLNIEWYELGGAPIVSEKDKNGKLFSEAEVFE